MHPALAGGVTSNASTWGYRELEQIAHKLMRKVKPDPVDHTFDWVTPTLVGLLGALLASKLWL